MTDNVEVFKALLAAIEAADPDGAVKLCADDVVIWHNTTMIDEGCDSLANTIDWLHENFTGVHYEHGTVRVGQDTVIGEVVLSAVAPDGDEVRTPTCIVADFRDGAISRMRVYLSSSHSLGTKVPR